MKMKKGLLTMLALLSMGSSAFAQAQEVVGTGTINVPEVVRADASKTGNQVIVLEKEKTGTIQIELKNSEGYRDLQFDLTLPEGVSLTTGENEEIVAKSAIQTHVMGYGSTKNRFVLYSESGAAMPDNILLKIPVTVADVTSLEEKTATLSNIHTSDDGATSISLAQATFPFRVMKLGDVNDDGAVNMADGQAIIFTFLGETQPIFVEEVANAADSDNEINMADGQEVIFMFLESQGGNAKPVILKEENYNELDPE